ncbi:hypothetical protein [Streptomyces sp. NPDC057280]|uniref:hypothetical protein n=1 Tax=Streptomyces sp. NPDC057280 TaxID=3346081 RepID=UPI0036261EA0
MRRWVCCALLFGLFIGLMSATPASAEDCGGNFPARLGCWKKGLGDGLVVVTLRSELPLDGSKADRATMIDGVLKQSGNLEVQVPAGVTTGEGGTVLLMLVAQNHRLVDPKAVITPLSPATRTELDNVCKQKQSFCDAVDGKGTLTGEDLVGKGVATRHHAYAVGSTGDNDRDQWLLFATATALILLLAAFVLLVRRTRTAPATGPATAARTADEPTRALRATPARATRARSVPRTGPTHPAVVRTDLHPQGYVELDRVLYRAVWAEPGQAAPPPGSRVDVADGPDSDVLYAFPPAAGRHAHAR